MHDAHWLTNHRAAKLRKFKNFCAGMILITTHVLALGQHCTYTHKKLSSHDSQESSGYNPRNFRTQLRDENIIKSTTK